LRTFDKRRLRPGGLEAGVEAEGEDGEAQALLFNQQSRVPKVLISLVDPDQDSFGYSGSNPDLYWKCGSGSGSMEMDHNLQKKKPGFLPFKKDFAPSTLSDFKSLTRIQIRSRIGLDTWIRMRTEIKSCVRIRTRTETNADPQH
jgi:hypothetical protein